MLGKNNMKFERKYFIRDIITKNNILKSFDLIEFENFTTFVRLFKMGQIKENILLKIPIQSNKEFQFLNNLLKNTGLTNFYNIALIMDEKLFLNLIKRDLPTISHIPIRIYLKEISFDLKDLMMDEYSQKWTSKNPIFYSTKISYKNYVEKLNNLPYLYSNKSFRFFEIQWDYESFNRMPIGELPKLEFWINHINIWRFSSKGEQYENIEINKGNDLRLSIFISEKGGLYYCRQHFEDMPEDELLNIINFKENYSAREMSKFLEYTKISKDVLYFPIPMKNIGWDYISFYYNKKMTGNVNEIPFITALINNWSWRI